MASPPEVSALAMVRVVAASFFCSLVRHGYVNLFGVPSRRKARASAALVRHVAFGGLMLLVTDPMHPPSPSLQ